MVGCRCKSEYGAGDSWSGVLGAVQVGPDSRGQIYNLGNLTFNTSAAATGDSWGVIPDGFIRSFNADIRPTNVRQLPSIDIPRR